ncbi:MAG: hypothetical protein IIB62_00335 [Proteobacteria bacterium]|nr:hypothetical protein [Pseudomonadota bacterium]
MAESESQSDVVPGTVFTGRQVRILKAIVIAMGILLVGGFILVISVIVYQASNIDESAGPAQGAAQALTPGAPLQGAIVPKGMTISHMALDENRLAIHLTGPGGGEIRIIDLATGKLVRRIPLRRE